MAITGGADLTDAEKATYVREAANAAAPISTAQMAFDDAEDEADKTEAAMMAATAAKLIDGIAAPVGTVGTYTTGDLIAGYGAAETIVVQIGTTPAATAPTATLSEDEDTPVAKNHGWTGTRYADPAGGDSYEAVVYSNVEEPTQGRKFGSAAAVTPAGAYEYQLTAGALPEADFVAANVAFTGVTRTAGTETFSLPDPNPSDAGTIVIPGSYHGVSGTYSCVPATGTTSCSAAVAEDGFTVSAADAWTFTPSQRGSPRHGRGGHQLCLVWLVDPQGGERRSLHRKRIRGRGGHSCTRLRPR